MFSIYHSYYNEKLRVDKLTFVHQPTTAWLYLAENVANKVFFDIGTEHMKYVNKVWDEIYSENCHLFESFTDFNLL